MICLKKQQTSYPSTLFNSTSSTQIQIFQTFEMRFLSLSGSLLTTKNCKFWKSQIFRSCRCFELFFSFLRNHELSPWFDAMVPDLVLLAERQAVTQDTSIHLSVPITFDNFWGFGKILTFQWCFFSFKFWYCEYF